MARNFEFAVDEFYHVYNRGNDKRVIFIDDNDRKRFLQLMYICNSEKSTAVKDIYGDPFEFNRGENLVSIGAYCLLSNHFHFLLHEIVDGGISKFMQKLSTGYTMYFNKRYDRSGSLFQGRFKAVHVINDRHLEYLFAYIHLNPIEHIQKDWKENGLKNLVHAKQYLGKYKYSSYPDLLNPGRRESKILNLEPFPQYFKSRRDFEGFHDIWLELSPEVEPRV